MSDKIYFSLGPVQGFVAQARRTRDLWSGSFLLSYLAGCAINEVSLKGNIIIPDIGNDTLLKWIRDKHKRDGEAPIIGSLPNRFEASANNPKSVALSAARIIESEWEKIANVVWTEFVEDVAEEGRETKAIWDRQVKNFWEISWVIGSDISAMNSRKNWRINKLPDEVGDQCNWRITRPPDEAGDHCTIMGDWQELSGFIRATQSDKQNQFWKLLKLKSHGKIGNLDIADGERLCALALIKRLFPKVSKKAIGWEVETKNWPSTPYMAAVPWLNQVMEVAAKDANDYAYQVLDKNTAPNAARNGISRQIGSLSKYGLEPFLNIDGNYYFENAVADWKRTPLEGTPIILSKRDNEPEGVMKRREELKGMLKGLYNKINSQPSSFYAMLLMDGDNMGKLIGGEKGGEPISRALSIFTRDVKTLVKDHDGVTIYAGGDDVLAMLPMPNALECALSLSQRYEKAFKDIIPEANATISAGLVFSHYHIPLRNVMEEAHHILDDVAKDQNGRRSIAVSVLKPSGKYCQWTVTWDRLLDAEGKTRIDSLVSKVKEGSQKQFSKSFFYGMRDDLAVLSGDQFSRPGSYAKLVGGLDPIRLLTAEYMKSREQEVTREEAEKRVRALLELSYKAHNAEQPNKTVISPDAVMLVKFLSQSAEGGRE